MPPTGQFCPVMMATEVLGDRWTPLILRDLLGGSARFNEIERGLPNISRSLLVQRLRMLEREGVVERRDGQYVLTSAGEDLAPVIESMAGWSLRWRRTEPRPEEVDVARLMWHMHRRMNLDRLPPGRTVVEFRFTGVDRRTAWLVCSDGEVSVCARHPGFESDVVVTVDAVVMHVVFAGHRSWQDAVADGQIRIDGLPRLVRALPAWFKPSPFAPAGADTPARPAPRRPASARR